MWNFGLPVISCVENVNIERMEYEKTAVSLLIVLWIFNSSIPSMVFTPSSHYFPSVSGASANLPRSRGTVPPPPVGNQRSLFDDSRGKQWAN